MVCLLNFIDNIFLFLHYFKYKNVSPNIEYFTCICSQTFVEKQWKEIVKPHILGKKWYFLINIFLKDKMLCFKLKSAHYHRPISEACQHKEVKYNNNAASI